MNAGPVAVHPHGSRALGAAQRFSRRCSRRFFSGFGVLPARGRMRRGSSARGRRLAKEPRGTRSKRSVVPETMRAAAIERFGPPSVLTVHRLPVPAPGPREVLIALHAAGVGSWDGLVRDGSWRPWGLRPRFPIVPGTDGAGVVAATGANVRGVRAGDRVWACHYSNPKGGFYAEYVAVD